MRVGDWKMGRGESKESMWPKLHHLYDNAIKIVVLMLFFPIFNAICCKCVISVL